MAHFAEINENNIVIRVLVVDNSDMVDKDGKESEEVGKQHLVDLFGGTWVQTSYNNNFRKQYAVQNFMWREDLDMFIDQKPYDSWVLNNDGDWVPPIPWKEGYDWDEENQTWIKHKDVPDSWIYDETLQRFVAPVPYPSIKSEAFAGVDGAHFDWEWDETNKKWVERTS